MKKLAANATVWMASTSTLTSQAKPTTVNQEILRYIALFFGGLSVIFLLLAVFSAWRGETTWRSAILILVFTLLSLGLYFWALRSANPLRVLVIQTILGALLCPFTYLSVDGILAPWWPGYVLMGFSGAVAWGLHMSRTLWAKLVLVFYLVNLTLTTLLGLPDPDLYDLGIRIGLIGLIGLMLIQMTEVLSQSLSKVYERSLQHRKAKEELQELTRLKTDFFSNVSHEFRTPITLTLGPLEAMLKGRHGEVGGEIRSQMGIMVRNQQRLLGLINQILDISKVEAGAAPLRASKVPDFNRFVQERLETFHPAAEARKIELRHAYDPLVQGMDVYIDQEKFDKIILNLLSNALKFTPKGFIEVATEIQGDQLLLKVSDSGIGIKESELGHIFDRFRQAEGSTTREYAGTGLGLALVQEFAKLHGGEVLVKSRYGEGTSFQVKIPLGKSGLSSASIVEYVEGDSTASPTSYAPAAALPETSSNCAELNAEMEKLQDSNHPTIVCAEDNPELRYFLRDMLMDSYNVFVAANGQDALEQVKLRRPDLILSDMMMPVMGGLDFCRKVREDRTLRPIPFVLLTGSSIPATKLESLEEGADDYLTKPFSESELLARVKNLVLLRRQQLKLERELDAARSIQVSLLPEAPQDFQGAVLDFHYYPSEGLSGDFCDILPKGDWVYFYVADVTSHGTASAQVTYLLKEIFFRLVDTGADDPPLVELVREAQKRYSSHRLEYDVALQMARFHRNRKTLEVLRANAPAPLKVRAGAAPQNLRVRPSPALSSDEPPGAEAFHLAEFVLEPGDSVYFFTDGCYEFSTPEGAFGLKRFHDLLNSAPDGDKWKQSVFEALVTTRGEGQFPDDMTFLKLKIT